MKVKTFFKKTFIIVFTTIGIFSTVNYFAGDLVQTFMENIKYTYDSYRLEIKGATGIGREWDSYSPQYKKEVFEKLNFKTKLELIAFLNSGVNEKIKEFETNIK